MKIIRDGKEYELTNNELALAYTEQQFLYDCENIKNNISFLEDGDKQIDKQLISDSAIYLRSCIDDGYSYEDALIKALSKIEAEYKKEEDMELE